MPTLLLKGPGLVKGEGFQSYRRIGSTLPMVRIYQTRQVDEMILLDVAATPEGRGPDLATIADVADECFMPLTVGGGVTTVEQMDSLFRIGADKVAVCTAAVEDDKLLDAASKRFGSQSITVAIDVKDGRVVTHCGAMPTTLLPGVWARICEDRGAGEILLTSVERDGTMDGYDLELIAAVSAAVGIPVVASGGASGYENFADAFEAGAHAVAASALYQFTEATPRGAKLHLNKQGIPVRL